MFGILRTLLAVYVVLLHIFSVPSLGNYAVSFFFILSGFLMTYVMQKSYSYDFSGIKSFWINRFLRLYPSYWLILLLSLLAILFFNKDELNPAMFFPSTIKEWFSNITMIFFDIVPHRIKPRVVPTTWALTNEIFFYILISFGISKTRKITFTWLFVSILYYIFTYIFYDLATFRYSAIPASSLPFAIGATLFWLNETLSKIKTGIISIFVLFALFNLNAIYLANSSIYFFREFSIYINHIIAALLILSLFTIKSGKIIKQIDTYIGHYSYPIYLSHYLVCAFFIHIFDFGHVDGEYKLLITAIFPFFLTLFAFCFVIVHGIDVKIDSFKTILKSKKKKSIANSLPQNILKN